MKDSSINLNCRLYDSNNLLMKSLPTCSLSSSDTISGSTYYIKYFYEPNPYQTTSLKDSIKVTTNALKPTCQIANSEWQYLKTSDTLNLAVSVTNQRSTFVYKWNCLPITGTGKCSVVSAT